MPAGIFMGQSAYTGVFPYLIFNGYYYRQIKDVTADFLASRKGQIALPHALNVADLYLCLFHSYCKKGVETTVLVYKMRLNFKAGGAAIAAGLL